MTENKRFIMIETNGKKCIHEIGVNDMLWGEYTTVEDIVDKLNEQYQTIQMWVKSSKKITKLFEENTKPTTHDGGDVYLNIDFETKRCKYERTIICNKCTYFSSYFLDCRLMLDDYQYKKALELGLVKE